MQSIINPTQLRLAVSEKTSHYRPAYIFVLKLIDGRYLIGHANNPCKRIAAINSGLNPSLPEMLQVKKVIGIKEQNESRNLISVFKQFSDKYGESKVIAI